MSTSEDRVIILGVDPGRTTGIALYTTDRIEGHRYGLGFAELAQTNRAATITIIESLIERYSRRRFGISAMAIERFVNGPRSGKLATPGGGRTARELAAELSAMAKSWDIPAHLRSAAEVKPWATGARIQRIVTHPGMPHAYDALRHALFCAVKDFRALDPLSRVDVGPTGRPAPMLSEPLGDAPPPPTDG